MSGWICLHRSIMDHWSWDKDEYAKAWITMLMLVNHAPAKVLIGGQLIHLTAGQSARSKQSWAECFGKGWTRDKVRTFFSLLERDEMITQQGTNKTTILTICKWGTYQNKNPTDPHQYPQQIPSRSPAGPQQIPTNNNDNNDKQQEQSNTGDKSPSEDFVPPTIQEVSEQIALKKYNVDPQRFIDHYQAQGWKQKNSKPIKDWKRALATWGKNAKPKESSKPTGILTAKERNDLVDLGCAIGNQQTQEEWRRLIDKNTMTTIVTAVETAKGNRPNTVIWPSAAAACIDPTTDYERRPIRTYEQWYEFWISSNGTEPPDDVKARILAATQGRKP